MRLSCRFLQIKEVNQALPQMTFIRLKTRHFRMTKDIWCWYKIANISRLCCYQMSNPTIWRFTADNYSHNILVAPSFVKRRKLIYTPINCYTSKIRSFVNKPGKKINQLSKSYFIENLKVITILECQILPLTCISNRSYLYYGRCFSNLRGIDKIYAHKTFMILIFRIMKLFYVNQYNAYTSTTFLSQHG